ncbi:MAG: glycosyltransferase [Pseudomonadota bacterium]
MWTLLAWIAASIWLVVLLLPWRPWSTREQLDSRGPARDVVLDDVTVLIPARNEDSHIDDTLSALEIQGRDLSIIVVDDQSSDATAERVLENENRQLQLVRGRELPAGWCGKLWAMEQGRQYINTRLVLLLDADIALMPGTIYALRSKLRRENVQLVSLLACLDMQGVWARVLMPAFVYFFKLLYPFHLSNSTFPYVAAAAGGCILMETRVLDAIGGFVPLRDALIDDCALARRVKAHGYRTWTGLTHSACSLRRNDSLDVIWQMVTRTAFTQLGYSVVLLLVVTVIMIVVFLCPVVALFSGQSGVFFAALLAIFTMTAGYLPVLRYYGLPPGWALSMPLTGMLFLLMTWSSALAYWRGTRSRWKERTYHVG